MTFRELGNRFWYVEYDFVVTKFVFIILKLILVDQLCFWYVVKYNLVWWFML